MCETGNPDCPGTLCRQGWPPTHTCPTFKGGLKTSTDLFSWRGGSVVKHGCCSYRTQLWSKHSHGSIIPMSGDSVPSSDIHGYFMHVVYIIPIYITNTSNDKTISELERRRVRGEENVAPLEDWSLVFIICTRQLGILATLSSPRATDTTGHTQHIHHIHLT